MKQTKAKSKALSNNTNIIIYQSRDGKTKIDVRLENETMWLSQAQIAELFERDISVISRHIKNIFAENELLPKSNLQILQIPLSDKPNFAVKSMSHKFQMI